MADLVNAEPWIPLWVQLAIAVACGGVIGVERQLRGKPAGIRTSVLICLGTVAFVRLGEVVLEGQGDPTRVLSQVITGIGFLGAGVILNREGLVVGMTSASVIWILAAIGAAIGFGREALALALTAVTVGVLVGVQYLERLLRKLGVRIRPYNESARQGADKTR